MANSKLSFACLRAHFEIWEGLIAGLSADAVVGQEAISVANGEDLTSGDTVRLVAYFEGAWDAPDFAQTLAMGQAISGSSVSPLVERLAQVDWAAQSQQGLEQLRVGRLLVKSVEDTAPVPTGTWPISIQAANAFGTGHHGTTRGCLGAVQRLARARRQAAKHKMKIADVGCGTALLAFAAARVFAPTAPIIASDIDARAIPTALANAKINGLQGRVRFFVASDVQHPVFRRHGGFDLVFANILSGLLVDMAPRLAQVVRPGGHLVLAGLLNDHAVTVARAYQLLGYRLEQRFNSDGWAILTLRRTRTVRARTHGRGDQRFHPLKGGNWMHW